MARLNQIHGMYKISNDDYLYVLTTFVVEPKRFIEQFGWRRLTKREEAAVAAVWANIGRKMNIQSVFTSYAEAERFHDEYERQHMRLSPTNVTLSEYTTRLFLAPFPKLLHPLGRMTVAALSEDHLIAANGTARPPVLFRLWVVSSLKLRAWLWWLLVPPTYSSKARITPTAGGKVQEGRIK